jgi:chromosome segregation ATPase
LRHSYIPYCTYIVVVHPIQCNKTLDRPTMNKEVTTQNALAQFTNNDVRRSLEHLWTIVRHTGSEVSTLSSEKKTLTSLLVHAEKESSDKSARIQELEKHVQSMQFDISHIEELREAMRSLDEQLAETKEQLNKKVADNENLIKQNAELSTTQTLYQDLLKENAVLEDERNALHGELEVIRSTAEKQTSEIDRLNEQVTSLKLQVEDRTELEQTLTSLQHELLRKNAENEEHLLHIELIDAERKEHLQRLQELETVAEDNSKLIFELNQLSNVSQRLQKEHSEQLEHIAKLTSSLDESKLQLDELTNKLVQNLKEKTNAEQRITELELALQQNDYEAVFKQREAQLSQQIALLENQIVEHQTQLIQYDELSSKIQSSQVGINLYSELIDKYEELEIKFTNLSNIYNEATNELTESKSKLTAVESQLGILSTADKSYQLLTEKVELLQRELELGERANLQQREQNELLEHEILELKKQLSTSSKSSIEIQKAIDSVRADYDKKIDILRKDHEHINNQLVFSKTRIMDLEDELRKELERNIALKKEMRNEEGKKLIQELQNEITQLKSERETYISQLAEVRNVHTSLEDHVHALNGDGPIALKSLAESVRKAILTLQSSMLSPTLDSQRARLLPDKERQDLLKSIYSTIDILESQLT